MHLLKRIVIYLLLTFAMALAILPTALQWTLPKIAQDFGYELRLLDIDFSPLTAELSVDGFQFKDAESQATLANFAHFSAKLDLSALFSRTIHIESLKLSDGELNIVQQNEQIFIAGYPIPTTSQTTEKEPFNWHFAIDRLQLNLWQFNFTQNQQPPLTYRIGYLNLNNLSSRQLELATLELNSLIQQQPIRVDLKIQQWQSPIQMQARIQTDRLELDRLQPLQQVFAPDLPLQLQGEFNSDITFDIQQNGAHWDVQQSGRLELTQFKGTFAEQSLQSKTLNWDGESNLQKNAMGNLSIEGQFNATDLHLRQKDLQLDTQQISSEIQANIVQNEADTRAQIQSHLIGANLSLKQPEVQLKLEQILSELNSEITFADAMRITSTGRVETENLKLQQAKNNLTVAKSSQTLDAMIDLQKQTLQQQGRITLGKLSLNTPELNLNSHGIDWNGKTRIENLNAAPTIHNDGKLLVKNTQLNQAKENGLLAKFNDGIQGEIHNRVQLQKDIRVQDASKLSIPKVQFAQNDHSLHANNVNWSGKLALQKTLSADGDFSIANLSAQQGEWSLSSALTLQLQKFVSDFTQHQIQSELTLKNSEVKHPLLHATSQSLTLVNDSLISQGETIDLTAKGAIKASNITLQALAANPQFQPVEFALTDLTLNDWNATTNGIEFANLTLDGLTLKDATNSIALQQLSLGESAINAAHLKMGKLTLHDSATQLNFDAEKHLSLQQNLTAWLAAMTAKNSPEKAKNPVMENQSNKSSRISLQGVEITGNHPVHLQFSKPEFTQDLAVTTLKLGTLDSTQPNLNTPLTLALNIGEYGKIDTRATLQPFAPEAKVTLKNDISALALTPYSNLAKHAIGYEIDSGQLNAQTQFDLSGETFTSETKLQLNKLTLNALDTSENQAFNAKMSMPLDAGLSLLRDKQDNIKLTLPVNGDIKDPNFDIGNVIAKAMSGAMGKASRTYLLLTLQPFGAIALIGEMALDQMKTVQLQSITFGAGSFKLSTEMHDYLQKVANIMQDKPKFQLQLCGGVSEQERTVLAKNSQTKVELITDEVMLQLASQRQRQIQQTLQRLNIPANRIISCRPKIRSKDTAPSVEIGF